MGKKKSTKKKGGLKPALKACKGKKGEKWNKCLRSHGIKKKK